MEEDGEMRGLPRRYPSEEPQSRAKRAHLCDTPSIVEDQFRAGRDLPLLPCPAAVLE